MTMIAGNRTGQNPDKGYHESALVTVHQPPTDINVPISSEPPLSEQPLTPNVPELPAVSAETTPPPTPPQSSMQASSRKEGESGSFHYSSLSCKPGSKNLCSTTTRGRHASSTPSSSLSPYYYVTLNPAPGASLEEYNITTSASPFTTVHRIQPSASPSTTQRVSQRHYHYYHANDNCFLSFSIVGKERVRHYIWHSKQHTQTHKQKHIIIHLARLAIDAVIMTV